MGYGLTAPLILPLVGVHFYFDITMEELNEIKVGGTPITNFLDPESLHDTQIAPPIDYVPPAFFTRVFATPRMGGHLLNLNRNRDDFARTGRFAQIMILGQNKGRLIFF